MIFLFIRAVFILPLLGVFTLSATPKLNLGLTSFLDGGPLRPEPGWYWSEIFNFYRADSLYDGRGNCIPDAPFIDATSIVTTAIYQGKREIWGAHPGVSAGFSLYPQSTASANPYGITSSGGGFGDFGVSAFLQFKPIMHHGRGLLVQRLEWAATFPTGKFCVADVLNPGSGVYQINPYWAATLFIKPRIATSWRINYNWSSKNPNNGIQFGDIIYLNWTIEWSPFANLWVGMNSYALKELKNSRRNGIELPNTRQQIFAAGPGFLYVPQKGVNLFFNLYVESHVRARTAGTFWVARLLYQF
jgi:anthranilate 1,2-dioxygenase (deaminating, decarboxylating) large subunit